MVPYKWGRYIHSSDKARDHGAQRRLPASRHGIAAGRQAWLRLGEAWIQ